ncbi:hypothetical protein [Pseudoxanthomonas beigongshangi]|uniref:hypothetical protein n=1 Tax=Pseudoxanthomonas beigongshangi TaxID=2782537 RepID=UPI00193BFF82|nr:hypothetical protein [Pseudoxanthomonas beigongshangi]
MKAVFTHASGTIAMLRFRTRAANDADAHVHGEVRASIMHCHRVDGVTGKNRATRE